MVERTVLAVLLGLALASPLIAAAGAVAHVVPESRALAWAIGGLLASGASALAWRWRSRFPASLDGAARRHPVRAGLWMLLALIALFQLGRLSAFMANEANTFRIGVSRPGTHGAHVHVRVRTGRGVSARRRSEHL
jgi:hypothetical protein